MTSYNKNILPMNHHDHLLLMIVVLWSTKFCICFQLSSSRSRALDNSVVLFRSTPSATAGFDKNVDKTHVVAAAASRLQEFDVIIAKGPMEWTIVADLRYDEWIDNQFTTSREAFRMATHEICQERCALGATIVLAKDPHTKEWIGVAEASPIEIKAALRNNSVEEKSITDSYGRYVTDVVTAPPHRRKGVARALMMALENHADHLWLHVAAENVAAREFYESIGYSEYRECSGSRIDSETLTEVSGSIGQILLHKATKH